MADLTAPSAAPAAALPGSTVPAGNADPGPAACKNASTADELASKTGAASTSRPASTGSPKKEEGRNILFEVYVFNEHGDMMGLSTTAINECGLLLVSKVDEGPIKDWNAWSMDSKPEHGIKPLCRILAVNQKRAPPKVLKMAIKQRGILRIIMETPVQQLFNINKWKPNDSLGLKLKATGVGLMIAGVSDGMIKRHNAEYVPGRKCLQVGDIITSVNGEKQDTSQMMHEIQQFNTNHGVKKLSLSVHTWSPPNYSEISQQPDVIFRLLCLPSQTLYRLVFSLILKLYPYFRSVPDRSQAEAP